MNKISKMLRLIACFLFGFSLPITSDLSEADYWGMVVAFVLLLISYAIYEVRVNRFFLDKETAFRLIEISSENHG